MTLHQKLVACWHPVSGMWLSIGQRPPRPNKAPKYLQIVSTRVGKQLAPDCEVSFFHGESVGIFCEPGVHYGPQNDPPKANLFGNARPG